MNPVGPYKVAHVSLARLTLISMNLSNFFNVSMILAPTKLFIPYIVGHHVFGDSFNFTFQNCLYLISFHVQNGITDSKLEIFKEITVYTVCYCRY